MYRNTGKPWISTETAVNNETLVLSFDPGGEIIHAQKYKQSRMRKSSATGGADKKQF